MRFLAAVSLAAVCAVVPACGGSDTAPSGQTGTLQMILKDSPFSDAQSLLVTFSEVDAHKSDQATDSWSKVPFTGGATARTCDLKKLQAAADVMGTGPLAAGHYTMVRLVVTSATIYFDTAAAGDPCAASIAAPAGRSASVTIPSGEIKLNREFDVAANTTTKMTLDFNGDQSVRQTGNGQYMMTPVIAIATVQ